ncbi:MAG: ABC transporter substrate-binding protein [Syntrophales bacterium]|nr:ABC transporter substrate-binding protein [Syntrophales bacterium]
MNIETRIKEDFTSMVPYKVFRFFSAAIRLFVLILPLILPSTASCSGPIQGSETITLALQWHHQSQFAGYYMALARGFYEKEGLDVRILRGGPDRSSPNMLRHGKADVAVMMLPTAIEARVGGLPVINIAQIVNRGNFLLVARRQPNHGPPITSLDDLEGRPVTLWLTDFDAPYLALFDSRNVRPFILPQYATLSLFLREGAVACSAMRYNEYHDLLQSGFDESDLAVFDLYDMGIIMPEDGLYILEETLRQRPGVFEAFVRASLEGWRYALDNEDETLDVIMDYVSGDNLPTNRVHMRWMLRTIFASIFPSTADNWEFGVLSREAYDATLELMIHHGSLAGAPSFENMVAGKPSP